MKKLKISLAMLAVVFALGSAFTVSDDPFWNVAGVGTFQGSESQIKQTYCAGADNVQCAVQVDQPSNIIYKP